MALHSDQLEMSVDIGSSLQFAVNESLLTNTNVAAADTNQGLQDAVTAATCAADVAPSKPRIIRAIQNPSVSAVQRGKTFDLGQCRQAWKSRRPGRIGR
jgi:hypothetical protein